MAFKRHSFKSELTTGFGDKGTQSAGRFYRKDGKANTIRRGINFFDQLSWYHTMLSLPQWKFWGWLVFSYAIVNCIFGSIYFFIGVEHLQGAAKGSAFQNFIEAYFFSAQTFTTVGYGRISPGSILTSIIASIEAFAGVLSFALASGLFYGRFSKPRSFLKFSDIGLIAPYKNGIAFMFRTVPFKNNNLMDAEVKLTVGMKIRKEGEIKNEFYPLSLEISKINALVLNWTLVHPINENSPLYGMSIKDMKEVEAEILVYLKAYDEGFANTVVARTSYTADEVIDGARFRPMYNASKNKDTTELHIDLLNDYEPVSIENLRPVLSE